MKRFLVISISMMSAFLVQSAFAGEMGDFECISKKKILSGHIEASAISYTIMSQKPAKVLNAGIATADTTNSTPEMFKYVPVSNDPKPIIPDLKANVFAHFSATGKLSFIVLESGKKQSIFKACEVTNP